MAVQKRGGHEQDLVHVAGPNKWEVNLEGVALLGLSVEDFVGAMKARQRQRR